MTRLHTALGFLLGFTAACSEHTAPTPPGAHQDFEEPEITAPSSLREACYPSEWRDWSLCIPTVIPDYETEATAYPDHSDQERYRAPFAFLDLANIDSNTSLSPNFILGEFAELWKGRWGIVQPASVVHLQQMRDTLGPIWITSGFRDPAYNASVGGVLYSRHMFGDGFDMVSDASLEHTAWACEEQGADYVEIYTSHVHCDWRNDPLDPAFFEDIQHQEMSLWNEFRDAEIYWTGDTLTVDPTGFEEGTPFLQWRAYDDLDRLITESTAQAFFPPWNAASVEVTVAGVLTRQERL